MTLPTITIPFAHILPLCNRPPSTSCLLSVLQAFRCDFITITRHKEASTLLHASPYIYSKGYLILQVHYCVVSFATPPATRAGRRASAFSQVQCSTRRDPAGGEFAWGCLSSSVLPCNVIGRLTRSAAVCGSVSTSSCWLSARQWPWQSNHSSLPTGKAQLAGWS